MLKTSATDCDTIESNLPKTANNTHRLTWCKQKKRDSSLKVPSVENNKRWKFIHFHKCKYNEVNNIQRLILLEKWTKNAYKW